MTFEVMSKGYSAEQVGDLQGRLLFLGYFPPPINYSFDDRTEAAVRVFQGDKGHEATGAVDEALWHALCADTDASGYSFQHAASGAYDGHVGTAQIHEHAPQIDIVSRLREVVTAVSAAAGRQGSGIESGCMHFKLYADERLKNLPDRYKGSDYLKYLTRHLAGTGGIKLTGVLTAGLAAAGATGVGAFMITSLWIASSMQLERLLGSAAQRAFASDEPLKQAVPKLEVEFHDAAVQEYQNLEDLFREQVDQVIEKLNLNVPLDQEVAWVEPLLHGDTYDERQFIEHYVGIPTQWVPVRDAVYHQLVAAFEEMVLGATEFAPNPLDGAAAAIVLGAHPEYGSVQGALDAQQAEKHRRAEEAAARAEHDLHRTPHHTP